LGGVSGRAAAGNGAYRPPLFAGALLPREELLTRLTDAKTPITLLLGPPGSGKTAALALLYDWLLERKKAALWVSVGSDDLGAIERRIEEFAAGSSEEAVILLDGFERLQGQTNQNRIERILLNLPPGCRVVMTGHHMHGAHLHDLWLRGLLEVVEPQALRFEDPEAGALLGPFWSAEEVSLLNGLMEGWAAGLRFLAHDLAASRALVESGVEDAAFPSALAGYFEDVVCTSLPPKILKLLMDLSALDRFSAAMLSAMPEKLPWTEIEDLIRRGALVRYLDEAREWAGFHPAFGRHLRRKLRHADPERFDTIRRFAATWFADRGFAAEAVRHAVRIADKTSAAQIIERAGAISVDLGDGPDVGLDVQLPPEEARELPLLFLAQIYNRLRHGKYREARIAFDTASRLTGGYTKVSDKADPTVVAAWARSIGIVFYSLEDVPVPAEDVAFLEAQLLNFLDTNPVLAAVIASVLAFIYVDRGDFAEAIRVSRLGFHAQRADTSSKVTLFLDLHYASALIATDTIGQAIVHVVHAQKLARLECGPQTYEVLTSQLMRGVLHYECNELEEARQNLIPVLEQLRSINGWLWLYLEGFGAAAATLAKLDGIEAALALVRAGEAFAEERNLVRLARSLALARINLLIGVGDRREAARQLEALMCDLEADANCCPSIRTEARLASALLMLDLGRPRDALCDLERIDPDFIEATDLRQRFAYHCLSMRCAFALRRYNSAVEHMLIAVGIARGAGLVRRVLDHSAAIVEVADWALRSGRKLQASALTYIDDLRTTCAQPAEGPKPEPGAQNFSLSPRESEIITLVAEGLSAKEIAARLGISEGTVKSHRKKIHGKLGVSSRSHAISRARELLII
jgi:LuxR family maltose regulon positive regulatory protein